MNAADWILISTPGSKYAHAPNWTPWGHRANHQAACGRRMKFDPYQMGNDLSEGKPPCPRCVERLRWHLDWLKQWVDSYENLTWEEVSEEDPLTAMTTEITKV